MKRIICLVMALIVTVTMFASCGGGETELPKDGKIQLTFYAREFEDWANDHLRDLVARFNAESDTIQVNVKFFTSDTYSDGLTVARENGKAPDLYMLEYGSLYTHAKNGYAAKLDGLLPQEALDDIFENVRDMVSLDGNVYAYPWLLEPATLFFYRKDILQENGIAEPPATWDELYAACEAIKPTRDLDEYCLGLPVSGAEYAWITYGMQYNTCDGLAVDESWLNSNIENPGYKALCEFFYMIYSNGYAPKAAITSEGYTYIVDALCEGKLAMTFGGSWSIAEIYQYYPEMAEKIGVTVIPTQSGDSQKTTSGNGGWTYCISASSKQQEAAAEFLKWMFIDDTPRAAEYFLKAYNSKAPTNATLQQYLQTAESDVDPSWTQVVYDVAARGIPEASYPWDISFAVGQMFETMQNSWGSAPFEQLYASALEKAKSTIASVMSRSSYEGNPKYGK